MAARNELLAQFDRCANLAPPRLKDGKRWRTKKHTLKEMQAHSHINTYFQSGMASASVLLPVSTPPGAELERERAWDKAGIAAAVARQEQASCFSLAVSTYHRTCSTCLPASEG